MKRIVILFAVLLLTLTTAGTALAWGGGGSTQVRVLHASPDAPPVNVLIDGRVVFPHVNYGQTTHYARLEPGTYNVKVVSADRDHFVRQDAGALLLHENIDLFCLHISQECIGGKESISHNNITRLEAPLNRTQKSLFIASLALEAANSGIV